MRKVNSDLKRIISRKENGQQKIDDGDETIEEVAVNMLYDMIKNPVWYDFDKQMAAIKFLLFLDWNDALFVNGEKRISDAVLVALILMIEKSRDEDREMIIRTALHCIC